MGMMNSSNRKKTVMIWIEKQKKKLKKEKKKKEQREEEGDAEEQNNVEEQEEEVDEFGDPVCSIKPEEIPDIPTSNFLTRVTSDDTPQSDARQISDRSGGGYHSSQNQQWTTRSGRRIKGRGALRYRTPSRSRSRSPRDNRRNNSYRGGGDRRNSNRRHNGGGGARGSETPPHWREAAQRHQPVVITLIITIVNGNM